MEYPTKVLELAREFVFASMDYKFTHTERQTLAPFFSNLDKRVFFMHSLPANIGATLLAMFSRIKNPRGIRGVFVDSFLPQFLAAQLPETSEGFEGKAEKFLKSNGIVNIETFIKHSDKTRIEFENFVRSMSQDPKYLETFASSEKAKTFLGMWLDTYGHNSIARMANLWLCFENISILAAKSIEWGRPGTGYIELSTRYVDFSKKGCYPIELELEAGWGVNPEDVTELRDICFEMYSELEGNNFKGPFPEYLRKKYGHLFEDSPKSLEAGVIGEVCDVLGNLLPASALTSAAVNVGGEALPELLKHLILDETPENFALVELILEESPKVGANQFARHHKPTNFEKLSWQYLPHKLFNKFNVPELKHCRPIIVPVIFNEHLEPVVKSLEIIIRTLLHKGGIELLYPDEVASATERGEFDKLPAEFESVTIPFHGIMSFRSWRDLHRQSFCAHFRTLLSPELGFYQHNKAKDDEFVKVLNSDCFHRVWNHNARLFNVLQQSNVPPILAQYPMALGNNIGFRIIANLREWEFCNWQRTKPSVNHEARGVFIGAELALREMFNWWVAISRASTRLAYVFARGEKVIPLE